MLPHALSSMLMYPKSIRAIANGHLSDAMYSSGSSHPGIPNPPCWILRVRPRIQAPPAMQSNHVHECCVNLRVSSIIALICLPEISFKSVPIEPSTPTAFVCIEVVKSGVPSLFLGNSHWPTMLINREGSSMRLKTHVLTRIPRAEAPVCWLR